jgi:hypothetical protein
MHIYRNVGVVAAFSLIGAVANAQSVAPPNNPTTSVMKATPNPELNGASTASRSDAPRVASATRDVHDGMQVKSESGEVLGTVASVMPADSSNNSYVVIADQQKMATVMPYATASAMVQHQALVVDKTKFEKAPKVQDMPAADTTRAGWEKKADSYWKRSTDGGVMRR